ncbi:MAG: hypothetical protein R2813_12225 [Flavobacteriales bacterium]
MRFQLTLLAFFISVTGFSQALDSLELEVKDTLKISGQDTTIYPKPKEKFISNILFQFDNRNEKYYDTKARMNGVRIGVAFYRRFRTGFGFYSNNNFYRMDAPNLPMNQYAVARLNYNTWFTELAFYRSFRWELSGTYSLGKGTIRYNTFDQSTSIPELVSVDTLTNIRIHDFGVNAQFKIFPWFGLGVGTGYRTLLLPAYPELQGPFSDPYFDFKIKVFLGYAYRSIFNRDKIEAERLYYEQRSRLRRAKFRTMFLER